MILIHDYERCRHYLLLHDFAAFFPKEAIGKLQLCSFANNEYLCRETEPAAFLYFLVEGRCKITRFLQNGKESLICFYHDFAVLGEFELIRHADAATTNVQAVSPVLCLRMSAAEAQKALMDSPLFLHFLCRHLCQKLIRSNRNLSINLNYPVNERVASYIASTRQGVFFQDNYTHLAEYLGCSHRQLLRVLHRFCEEGILRKENGAYRILDEKQLLLLAGDVYSP